MHAEIHVGLQVLFSVFFLVLSKPEMYQQILKQTSVVESYASMSRVQVAVTCT
jgi:hypothetical protein